MERFRKEEKGIALLESTEITPTIRITEGYLVPNVSQYNFGMELIISKSEIKESIKYVRDFGDNNLRATYVDITDLVLEFWLSKRNK